jgi:hypothetical protein
MGDKAFPGALPQGKERLAIKEAPTAAGSKVVEFGVDADTVILSLYATSVSGDLDVTAETLGGEGSVEVISFPTISSPTTDLLIKKAATSMDRIRITATYTDGCDYEVRVRGIGTGATSVQILGAQDAKASQEDIGTTASVLVPSALTDRAGLILKNNNTSGILYIGFTSGEATTGNGYPIGPGESIGIDVAAGQEVYGIASAGTVDVRLMEAGG